MPPRLRATWDPSKDFRTKALTPAQYEALRRGAAHRSDMTLMLQMQAVMMQAALPPTS